MISSACLASSRRCLPRAANGLAATMSTTRSAAPDTRQKEPTNVMSST
jgi:hypothetical protein